MMLYEQAPQVPLTRLSVIFPKTGACLDPAHQQGLGQLTLQLMQRGAGGLSAAELHEELEGLGATLGHSLANDHFAFQLVTLSTQLAPALALLAKVLLQPHLEASEFARVQQEQLSGWFQEREENKAVWAQEVYLQTLYGGPEAVSEGASPEALLASVDPRGFSSDGTAAGLAASSLEAAQAHYQTLLGQAPPLVAALSNLPQAQVEQAVQAALGTLWQNRNLPPAINPWERLQPKWPTGQRVVILPDEATQTDEIVMGGFGTIPHGPNWHMHRLATLLLGGDMNSRLFRQIRGERGLSYGASCWFEGSIGHTPRNQMSAFTLYTFPAQEHTAEAVPLLQQVYRDFAAEGLTEAEIQRGVKSLSLSHAFLTETPRKRLALAIQTALYGVSFDDMDSNEAKLAAVTPKALNELLAKTHQTDQLVTVMLGEPKRLRPIAETLPNVVSITQTPPLHSALQTK